MLHAIGHFFLGKGDQELSWENPLENQKESISTKFGELCRAQGGIIAWMGEERDILRPLWHNLQQHVLSHTKRGEGPEIYLRVFTLHGTLNLTICSS